jgi:hypothetical protein
MEETKLRRRIQELTVSTFCPSSSQKYIFSDEVTIRDDPGPSISPFVWIGKWIFWFTFQVASA